MIQTYLKPPARKISMPRFVFSFEEKMFITFQGNWSHRYNGILLYISYVYENTSIGYYSLNSSLNPYITFNPIQVSTKQIPTIAFFRNHANMCSTMTLISECMLFLIMRNKDAPVFYHYILNLILL